MQHTTSEERLVNLIKKYIGHKVGDTIKNNISGYAIKCWEDDDGIRHFETNTLGCVFIIDRGLFHNVKNVFSIPDNRFLNSIFIDWFNSKQDSVEVEPDWFLRTGNLQNDL